MRAQDRGTSVKSLAACYGRKKRKFLPFILFYWQRIVDHRVNKSLAVGKQNQGRSLLLVGIKNQR
jgi:hypothetical protein